MYAILPRCFVALLPDAAARAALAAIARAVPESPATAHARWTRPRDLHLTLRYLGDCAEEALDAALAAVPLAPADLPLRLRSEGLEYWPPRRPRLLVLRLAAQPPLSAWAAALEEWAVARGAAPERRPLVPHVTLARGIGARATPAPASPGVDAIGFDALAAMHRDDRGGAARYAVHGLRR